MKAESSEVIKIHLDNALHCRCILIGVLKEGLSQTDHLHLDNPVLYTKIEFSPMLNYDGYYSGLMFYPNGKSQGLMDFDAGSFRSLCTSRKFEIISNNDIADRPKLFRILVAVIK